MEIRTLCLCSSTLAIELITGEKCLYFYFQSFINMITLSLSLCCHISHIYFISVLCIHTILSSPYSAWAFKRQRVEPFIFGSGPGLKTSILLPKTASLCLFHSFYLLKKISLSIYKTLIVINHFSFLETVLLAETSKKKFKVTLHVIIH